MEMYNFQILVKRGRYSRFVLEANIKSLCPMSSQSSINYIPRFDVIFNPEKYPNTVFLNSKVGLSYSPKFDSFLNTTCNTVHLI